MAADGYFLTEGDKAFLSRLREMIERNGEDAVLSVIRNQPPAELASTTECYVARTPQGGIPALTPGTPPELRTRARDGVGIFYNTDDQPGRALCDIWRVVKEETPPRRVLKPVPLLAQWVFNPSLTPIPENAWVPVVRDKFGGWWPAAAGGEQGTRPVSVIDGPYDGYYVGIIDMRDENGATPPERWVTTWVYVAVVGYNDEALEIGKRYKASKTSDHPSWGLPVYAVQPGGGGSGNFDSTGVKLLLETELAIPEGGFFVPWTRAANDTNFFWDPGFPDRVSFRRSGYYLATFHANVIGTALVGNDFRFNVTPAGGGGANRVCRHDPSESFFFELFAGCGDIFRIAAPELDYGALTIQPPSGRGAFRISASVVQPSFVTIRLLSDLEPGG